MIDYEYVKELSPFWSWVLLIGFVLFVLGTGFHIHTAIPEAEPEWDFGALENVPGASVYSTWPLPQGPAIRQVEMLPDAVTDRVDRIVPAVWDRKEPAP